MSRQRDDDHPRSPVGRVSTRAWAFSGDSEGNDLPKEAHPLDVRCDNCGTRRDDCASGAVGHGPCCADCWHPDTVPVRETRAYAPAPVDDRAALDAALDRQRQAVYDLSRLSDEERTAWDLHERVEGWKNVHRPFPAAERDEQEAAGWFFVKAGKHGQVEMSKQFQTKLTYEQIGERMDVSAERVHSLLKSARRKMKAKQ